MTSEDRPLLATVDTRTWGFPWPGVLELARAVPCAYWSLVGGLMVQMHCRANNDPDVRATNDIDTLAHVEILDRNSLGHLKAGLRNLGYNEKPSIDDKVPLHRFVRDEKWQVDFLIADHVAPAVLDSLPSPTPVQAPGGTNALDRTVEVKLVDDRGVARVSVPDIVGALMLKVEAYTVDTRDRDRHLQDAARLARLLNGTNSGRPLHGDGPTRIRRLIHWLDDDRVIGRARIGRDAADDAAIALEDLLAADPNTPEGSS